MKPQRRMLVDTNVVSFVMRRSELGYHYRELLRGTEPYIALATVEELYFGAAKYKWGDRRRLELDSIVSEYYVLRLDEVIALVSARLRVECESVGRTLSSADAWIAATALCHELPLVSHDQDFDGIYGLNRVTLRPQH